MNEFKSENIVISEINVLNNCVIVYFDWYSLTEQEKKNLVRSRYTNEEADTDLPYCTGFVIGLKGCRLDLSDVYLYVDEYAPNDELLNMIDNLVSEEQHGFLTKIELSAVCKVQILSMLIK